MTSHRAGPSVNVRTLGTIVLALATLLSTGASAFADADPNAKAACQLAQAADDSGGQDLATLRALVQQVSSAASQSAMPDVRRSATMLGRSARQSNPVGIQSALRSFRETCGRVVGVASAQGHEVPAAEFDRQLHDVLERTGRPGASCEKQQFGDGWAAVCK